MRTQAAKREAKPRTMNRDAGGSTTSHYFDPYFQPDQQPDYEKDGTL